MAVEDLPANPSNLVFQIARDLDWAVARIEGVEKALTTVTESTTNGIQGLRLRVQELERGQGQHNGENLRLILVEYLLRHRDIDNASEIVAQAKTLENYIKGGNA